jgi:hypothetical protein
MLLAIFGSSLASETPSPVEFRLLAPSSNVCTTQQKLELEAILTNKGDDELVINAEDFDSHILITRYENGVAVKFQSIIKDRDTPVWKHLGSHQSIIIPFSESLNADELLMHRFDRKPGLYEIQMRYSVYAKGSNEEDFVFLGHALSNRALFLLSPCKKEPSKGEER